MEIFLHSLQKLFSYDPANPMIFNSGAFLLFFIFFMTIYSFIHKNRLSVTLFVITFSLFFYYKSSGLYVSILIITAIADYLFALKIHKTEHKGWRKFWLFASVGSSLFLLFFFKYTNFFVENLGYFVKYFADFNFIGEFLKSSQQPLFTGLNEIVVNNFQPYDIFLPIGISFYTFQSISYVVDVYRTRLEPTDNFLDYLFFLSFFPQLVAGPIVKANLFLPQLKKPIVLNKELIWLGLWMVIIGLFKKAVIADYISQYNDFVFLTPHTFSGFENLMAILGYTLQIYCDFSGYSDMAIGLGLIMGFDLGINFDFPYKSLNITDFWRRWHISLSSWLRDYLYIPLGGNRHGTFKMYRNLFLTMFLGGLWHGANWKFVIWGAAHGLALALHKALKPKLDRLPKVKPIKFLSWFITFVFVMTLWIFFRAGDIPETSVSQKITHGANYDYYSQIIAQTDSSKTVRVYFLENNIHVHKIEKTLKIDKSEKIRIKEKIKGKDKVVTIQAMIPADDVAFFMIGKVLFDMDLFKYLLPFWKAHKVWVILFIIGFAMHFAPKSWADFTANNFVKLPYPLKLVIFIIIVQLVIQFKNEDVVPFIYFQF